MRSYKRSLKSQIEEAYISAIEYHKEMIRGIRKSIKSIEKINFDGAHYKVSIDPSEEYHTEGLTVVTDHTGTLREAIEKAEKEFIRLNRGRGASMGSYSVGIVLEELNFPIPDKYWRRFKGGIKKRRKNERPKFH